MNDLYTDYTDGYVTDKETGKKIPVSIAMPRQQVKAAKGIERLEWYLARILEAMPLKSATLKDLPKPQTDPELNEAEKEVILSALAFGHAFWPGGDMENWCGLVSIQGYDSALRLRNAVQNLLALQSAEFALGDRVDTDNGKHGKIVGFADGDDFTDRLYIVQIGEACIKAYSVNQLKPSDIPF